MSHSWHQYVNLTLLLLDILVWPILLFVRLFLRFHFWLNIKERMAVYEYERYSFVSLCVGLPCLFLLDISICYLSVGGTASAGVLSYSWSVFVVNKLLIIDRLLWWIT